MGMWSYDIEDCDKTPVRTDGECILCSRHLCAKHLKTEYHTRLQSYLTHALSKPESLRS